MKIEKIIENNDQNRSLTEVSAYAILSLICGRINNITIGDDKSTIDNFFLGYNYNIDYDKYINIANAFVKNNFEGYHPDMDDTQELKTINR